MFKGQWIAPTQSNLRYLKGISNGSLTWYVSLDEIRELHGVTHDSDDLRELAKELCIEHIKELKNSRTFTIGLLDIDNPMEIEKGVWCVNVFATDHLLHIISVLASGVWWNHEKSGPDYAKTELEWRAYLNRKFVTDEVFETASRNRDPELKKIRSELVLFKLTAEKSANGWRPQHA